MLLVDERAISTAEEYRRRKATSVLTIMFTDIAGSTELREELLTSRSYEVCAIFATEHLIFPGAKTVAGLISEKIIFLKRWLAVGDCYPPAVVRFFRKTLQGQIETDGYQRCYY